MKVNFYATCLGDVLKADSARDTVLLLEKIRLRSIISRAPGLLWSAST